MKYSAWQIDRIRSGLRAYKTYGKSDQGTGLSWIAVQAGIAEYSDIELDRKAERVFAERLRQFVEGYTAETGIRRYPVLKKEWLDAVVYFLSDSDIGLLTKNDLSEPEISFHASLRLAEYLGDPSPLWVGLSRIGELGTYQSALSTERQFVVRTLCFDGPMENGIVAVKEEVTYYPKYAENGFESWSEGARKLNEKARNEYRGWAVISPENQLCFFLKHIATKRNRIFQSAALNPVMKNTELPEQIIVVWSNDKPPSKLHQNDSINVVDDIKNSLTEFIAVCARKP